ncbi:GIDE domain-containing protein [Streptomyces alkaliterrae]|uniref:RING-type E3 ubiquitin transferase n=1 Tax=Streptomyces alkaliterrae TaxID=2213162 RepID=A0A5P0YXG8_9ACTN|nr:GIDE domain-containing protein [Streptomyces alkaliterrae]MBB1253007.1 hypothetical protein [Streptomyces alkaliterrae]MBB1257526.1 hypothetical protein [Streptomyces alkaliterrae]MQS04680.1 hypothetical protein [Streptomyces alkaliterrae]
MVFIGVLALVFAVLFGILAHLTNKRISKLERTETLTVAELRAMREAAADAAGPGHFRYSCEVVGVALPHRDGLLKSQLQDIECVWHRHKITRKYEEIRRDSNGNRRRTTRHETVSALTSGTAFFVEDDSGKIVIRPEGAEAIGADKTLDDFVQHQGRGEGGLRIGPVTLTTRQGDGTLGFKHEEWVLRPGARLFVHGEATDARGHLEIAKPTEGGPYIVSAKSEEELLRRDTRQLTWWFVGSGLCGLAGVVLLLVALLR